MSTILGRINPGLVLPALPAKPSVLRYRGYSRKLLGRLDMAYRGGFNQGADAVARIFDFHTALGSLASEVMFHVPTELMLESGGLITSLFGLGNEVFQFGTTVTQSIALVNGRKVLDAQPTVANIVGESMNVELLLGLPGWTLICPLQYNLVTSSGGRTPVSLQINTSGMVGLGLNANGAPFTQARRVQNGTSVSASGPTGTVVAGQWLIQAGDLDAAAGEVRTLVNGAVVGSDTSLGAGTTISQSVTSMNLRIGSATSTASGAKICGPIMFPRKLTLAEHATVNAALKVLYPWLP